MRPFEEEFELLNNTLLEMGAVVAHSIHRSVYSLIERNSDYAHQVLRDEGRVDQMEIQIDDLATSLIVREQPVARDMRFVVVAIKINTDLERMGDLAVSIVERALAVMNRPVPQEIDFAEISSLVESMVLGALDSFIKRDVDKAHGILAADDAVDAARHKIREQVIEIIRKDPASASDAIDYLTIARNLERIADHATNVAEDVIFLVQGVDIRHRTPATVA
jgi:phosphate transport system protein